jgi:cytochrome c oxidase subunit 2
MKRLLPWKMRVAWASVLACPSLLAGCKGYHSALDPAGPQSRSINTVIQVFFWVSLIVYALVLLFSILAIRKAKARGDVAADPPAMPTTDDDRPRHRAITIATILTVLILFGLLIADFIAGRRIHAFASSQNQLVITITAYQWWWDIRYEDPVTSNVFTTANEIHIPIGRPVRFNLRSNDVIHSFWIPNLHGKKDVFPDHETSIWLQADREGVYDGQCAEFCGAQHAQMRMQLVAENEEKFNQWLSNQRKPATQPATDVQKKGQQVFLSNTCIMCHTISGTQAAARLGPNLSHVASRQRIAAGTLPNTPGHLAGWIVDPQKIKPGTRMPQNPLNPDDLRALLEYLQSLK